MALLRPEERLVSGFKGMEKSDDDYFRQVSASLKAAQVCQPTLIIDRKRLDHNIEAVKAVLSRGLNLRIVVKSLPSSPLLSYLMEKTGTERLMCFHIPFVLEVARLFPFSSILLGKPMPVEAVNWFYGQLKKHGSGFSPETNLQWLIDSFERLEEYEALAEALGVTMQVNLEINVGLERGGFCTSRFEEFHKALSFIKSSPHLRLSGLMGYEVFIVHLPSIICTKEAAFAAARAKYQVFRSHVEEMYAPDEVAQMTFNTGGSNTYSLYEDAVPANEISLASAFVQPEDFDRNTLAHHKPAAFIAAPILKVMNKPKLPMVPKLSALMRIVGRLPQKSCFIYGGNWLATPCFPKGISRSKAFGHSSNQEMYDLPANSGVKVNDFLFFRPAQSEAVFLQFGDIAVFDGSEITEYWPVLRQNH
ncbi:alanine racemase [Flexibacterium corallicola]|uniref:alanine racemase n=1 Tax=Flexibacterium corallicola TaxID=3037259 RepID=UPI00286EE60B|nr:alanine racemase [Pseudovibrio sp. M1P-2-3]